MTEDTSDMERRLAAEVAEWKAKDRPALAFVGADRKTAAAFVGHVNIDTLERRRQPRRSFKPMPVHVRYEFWCHNGSEFARGGWSMERIENGRRSDHSFQGDVDDEVRRLKAAGFTVQRIYLGDQKPVSPKKKEVSDRKAVLDRLARFKA